jgi:hypothetical protein
MAVLPMLPRLAAVGEPREVVRCSCFMVFSFNADQSNQIKTLALIFDGGKAGAVGIFGRTA